MNEETPRDRSERPDIDSHEGAWPQQFVIGNDEAELKLSVESRSFVNRVNDQVRKRQKRITNVTEDGGNILIWGMFMTVTLEAAVFIGKELHEQLSIHSEHNRSHTQTNVRHIYKIGVWTRWALRIGNNWLGESFMKILVINWWRKSHQSSTHEGLRLFGFCVVPWEDFRKPSIERCMGAKIRMVEIFFKITKTLTESTVSRWNSSGIFSQDSIRCSSVQKSSNVYCSD